MEFGQFVIMVVIIGYSFYRVHRVELEVQVARIDKLEVGLKLRQRGLLQVYSYSEFQTRYTGRSSIGPV